jgi:Ca2+-dependent lipid-binding protein
MQKNQQAAVVSDTTKGVLMVEVPRCTDLPLVGPTCDSYVELRLSDPDNPNGPDICKSEVVLNERSPRYRCKKDFVYVSATSTLTLTVYDVPGMMEMSNIMKLGQKADTSLGKVVIHVRDVARAGRLKDSFPLQDADQGDMHVLLSWTTVERDD